MNLYDFLDPVSLEKPEGHLIASPNILGKNIAIHTPDNQPDITNNIQVALLGVPEDRNSFNRGASLAPERIRARLYQLYKINLKIIDLGNIKQGNTYDDTYVALKEVLNNLLSNNIVVALIGGTQELTIPVFQLLESYRSNINLTTIDRTIDIIKDVVKSSAESFLTEVIFKKRLLFKYCNLGHQIHLTDKENIELIGKLYHDIIRLGEVRSDITAIEPILRDSDIISFDISAIRRSDAPAFVTPSPSGFYAEEACQLGRYSGLSDRIMVFGLFEVNPKYDIQDQTSILAAQIVWYFLDGYSCRNPEFPDSENKNFKTFIVGHSDLDYEMTFYKSLISERWWMEVPNPKSKKSIMISCSYSDYQKACAQEVPDLWWKSFQKLS
jgi:arginase family enzyme